MMSMGHRQGLGLVIGGLVSYALNAWAVTLWSGEFGTALALAMLAIHAGLVLTGMLVAWALRRWQWRPVEALQAQVIDLGQGRFVQKPQPEVPEWQPLAKEINVAAARLQVMFRERNQEISSLLEHVNQDPVTELASRVYFMDRLRTCLAGNEGEAFSTGACMILRVDDLAGFNQRVGRSRADDLLRAVASLLRLRVAKLGEATSVARLNGADFAVLAPAVAPEAFQSWLVELSGAVDGLRGQLLSDRPCLAWLGATTYTPGDAPAEVMARADAMVQTCETTREPWRMSTSAQPLHSIAMADWRVVIEDALESGRITMGLYEVVRADGQLLHLEASARLTMPDGRCLSGAEIIPPAVRIGRTVDIDLRVVSLALEHIRRTGQPVAVNIAPGSVSRPAFCARLLTLLTASRDSAAHLSLEVDEWILRDNRQALGHLAAALVPLGTRLGIDHVFEQLPSLTGLGAMPLHYLKLDSRLVHLVDSPGSRRYMEICLSIAHAEGLRVVATGVDHPEVMDQMLALGMDGCTGPAVSRRVTEPA